MIYYPAGAARVLLTGIRILVPPKRRHSMLIPVVPSDARISAHGSMASILAPSGYLYTNSNKGGSMENKEKKIIVAGHISCDITPSFYPTRGKSLGSLLKPGKLIHIGKAVIANGGCVNNTGMALHKFGADVTLMAKIGADDFGRNIRERCEIRGAKTKLLVSKDTASSYTIVMAPPGFDRTFLHFAGANDDFTPDDLDFAEIAKADYFHFGYPTVMKGFYREEGKALTTLYQRIKELGLVTSLDVAGIDPDTEPGQVNWPEILKRTLPYVDIFVPSFEELLCMLNRPAYEKKLAEAGEEDMCMNLSLSKDILPLAKITMELGCRILLLKCGAAGMYLQTAQDFHGILGLDAAWQGVSCFQKSFCPDRIASAIGAGDTAIGAFLYGVSHGLSWKESLEIAAATGASCITEYDTYSGLLSIPELMKKIKGGWELQDFIKE